MKLTKQLIATVVSMLTLNTALAQANDMDLFMALSDAGAQWEQNMSKTYVAVTNLSCVRENPNSEYTCEMTDTAPGNEGQLISVAGELADRLVVAISKRGPHAPYSQFEINVNSVVCYRIAEGVVDINEGEQAVCTLDISKQPTLNEVVTTTSLDLDNDGKLDNVYLVGPKQNELDLYVKLSSTEKFVVARNFVTNMSSDFFGMGNEFDKNEAGSLIVRSYNEAMGRGRWQEDITIVFRNGALRVGGYTFTSRDTIDLDEFFKCDINALNGHGEGTNAKGDFTFKVNPAAKPIEETDSLELYNDLVQLSCLKHSSFNN